jgi:hypothetical protein
LRRQNSTTPELLGARMKQKEQKHGKPEHKNKPKEPKCDPPAPLDAPTDPPGGGTDPGDINGPGRGGNP